MGTHSGHSEQEEHKHKVRLIWLVISSIFLFGTVIYCCCIYMRCIPAPYYLRWIVGLSVSGGLSSLFLWSLFYGVLYRFIEVNLGENLRDYTRHIPVKGELTVLIGIFERLSVTLALVAGYPQWIAIWLVLKVASARRGRPSNYNVFLIGSLLSIAFGIFAAWIVKGCPPLSRFVSSSGISFKANW